MDFAFDHWLNEWARGFEMAANVWEGAWEMVALAVGDIVTVSAFPGGF